MSAGIPIPTPDNPFVIPLSNARTHDWRDDALCAESDPEIFFHSETVHNEAAKDVCGSCDVREQCLEWAMDNDEDAGVWGGLDRKERQALRRKRRRGPVPAREPKNHRRNRAIIEDRLKGAAPDEVAAKFGVSVSVVHRVAGPAQRRSYLAQQASSAGGIEHEVAQAI